VTVDPRCLPYVELDADDLRALVAPLLDGA
jgi:hypothetical protein